MHRYANVERGLVTSLAVLLMGLVMAGCRTPDAGVAPLPLAPSVRHQPHLEVVEDFAAMTPDSVATTTATAEVRLERISTVAPWPRGLTMVDGRLIALSRGRHRGHGGVGQDLNDMAGTLFEIDPAIAEPVVIGQPAGEAVRGNGRVLALADGPPFFPYDRSTPPEDDRLMSRPYCGLTYDPVSRNLIICAFSGAELDGGSRFRKHATDSLLRYDLRDRQWRVVEQHDPSVVPHEAMGPVIANTFYPHHDPASNPPPHGWLNGPAGCKVVGDYLYGAGKDNHLIVQYDLASIRQAPDAAPPASRPVLGPHITLRLPDGTLRDSEVLGACAVASHGGYLYIAYRTSSVVIRVPITSTGQLVPDQPAELIAVFEPWNPQTRRSADIFDMTFNSAGELFVSNAREGRVWRLTPDPALPFYGNDQSERPTTAPPFLDLTQLLGKRTSSANLHIDERDRLYVATRNNDTGEGDLYGTIYRVDTR